MGPTRLAAALCVALVYAGCNNLPSSSGGLLRLNPILDSIYVGDRSPPPVVTFFDASGIPQTLPSGIRWSSDDPTVLGVDNASGRMTGVARGATVIRASVPGVQEGRAFVVVSDTLDITLLLDTVYVMPGDTLTVPVVVLKKTSPPPAMVWFKAPPSAPYTIDSASGKLTAGLTASGPISYFVHANALVATGAVAIVSLTDTTGGKVFYSVLGTVITHVGGAARATNYSRSNGKLAFQLRGAVPASGFATQVLAIVLPDSVTVTGAYAIDSLNPAEDAPTVGLPPALCSPPRAWAFWKSTTTTIGVAYSRKGGTLGITQLVPVANGQAISGRFTYTAQRSDIYSDPLGALSIHGSFVAPLITDRTTCR